MNVIVYSSKFLALKADAQYTFWKSQNKIQVQKDLDEVSNQRRRQMQGLQTIS